MLHDHHQTRFATSCTEAAFGYANATSAAYAELTDQMLDMWSGAVRTMMTGPEPEPRSWYRKPLPLRDSSPFTAFRSCIRGSAALPWTSMQPWLGTAPAASPILAGMDRPLQVLAGLNPWIAFPFGQQMSIWSSAWPMAFAMMVAGVPQSVAEPMAKANVAALDAVDAATKSMANAFSSYRSDSGYAVAQIIAPHYR